MYSISVQHTGFRPAYKYWHVFWYVLVCIKYVLGMYSNTIHVDSSLEAHIDASIVVCIGINWFVLVCISTYMLVFDHKLVVNTPTWCHACMIHASTAYNRLQETGAVELSSWLNFFFPILEQFCLLFIQIAQKGLILPRQVSFCPDGVSFCPQHHSQPMFFTQQSHTPFLDMYLHKIPQNPPQNTCFPGLNL